MITQEYGTLQCHQLDGGPSPSHLVVLCHGYGAPGTDLAGLAPDLLNMLGPAGKSTRLVFPEAPIDMTAMGLPGGRAWWPLNMASLMEMTQANDFSQLHDATPPGLNEAAQALVESIAAMYKHTFEETMAVSDNADARLTIGGFSQGAMVTMHSALKHLPAPPKNLIQFSGTLICREEWTASVSKLGSTNLVISHGRQDPVLPFSGAEQLRNLVQPAAASMQFVEFNGPHTIGYQAMMAASELIQSSGV
ncbi:MAG: lysophospholipase, partial [Planctomycetota bacterium]